MEEASKPGAVQGEEFEESFGVLAGWTHSEFSGRLDLRLQTIRSSRRNTPDEVDSHHIIMTKSQAAVLANYLLQVVGQSAPRRRRGGLLGWLTRG